jgi:hypothetical protein
MVVLNAIIKSPCLNAVGQCRTPYCAVGLILAFFDEALRVHAECAFNRHVDGYTLTIGTLHFHQIGLSVNFGNLRLVQNEYPDLPVVDIPMWYAGIHWKGLLHGYLVGDHSIERPTLRMTLQPPGRGDTFEGEVPARSEILARAAPTVANAISQSRKKGETLPETLIKWSVGDSCLTRISSFT